MTPDDDIALFARGYYGRFGVDARWRAADQAARLGAAGDSEGEAVWRRVVVEVERVAGGWRPAQNPEAASLVAANESVPDWRRAAGRGR